MKLIVRYKYRDVWLLGWLISFRSVYQREWIAVSRAPRLIEHGGDGDSVGVEVARYDPEPLAKRLRRSLNRLGAILFPRCATCRVKLERDSGGSYGCPVCRKELQI